MRLIFNFKKGLVVLVCIFAVNNNAKSTPPATQTGNKPILNNKKTNPNYDPNKGILGTPREEKIIKRTRDEPILNNKKTNPNYDPNKGILGKPREEKVIKRTRDEPILKNRKYEPKRNSN